jgi:hypothetical protein
MVPMSLGATSGAADHTTELIVGGVVLLAVIFVAGGLVIPWIRRRYHPSARRQDGTQAGGFEMERLKELHRTGEVSEEEYRRLRRLALGLPPVKAETNDSTSSDPPAGVDDGSIAPTDGSCADGHSPQKESE